EVADGVCFGRLPDRALARERAARGVRTVVDLTAEHAVPHSLRGAGYVGVPMMDLAEPERAMLEAAADAIEHGRRRGAVYVHCALGYGRSARAVAWWLWRTGRAHSLEQAGARVLAARPRAHLQGASHVAA
ncbi:MAG: serine/threonine protein phosphatase, partial [Planctomycetota bacterium]